MEERNLVERSRNLGTELGNQLAPLREHPNVGDVRLFGFLAGIELVTDKESKTPVPVELMGKVIGACKRRGVIVGKNGDTVAGYNNVFDIIVAFVVSDAELTQITQSVIEAIAEVFPEGMMA